VNFAVLKIVCIGKIPKMNTKARCGGHAYNPSTWKTEERGSPILDCPGLHGESLSQKTKKNKKKGK
jgi:hypothetical protein